MVTSKVPIQIEIEIEEGVAYICCPYCSKPSCVSLSYSKQSIKPWWNTSNFAHHVELNHKDCLDFDTETNKTNCEYEFYCY